MAVAYAKVEARPDAGRTVYDITLDTAYPAGGYPLDYKQLGLLSAPTAMNADFSTAQGFVAQWDPVNSKLKLWEVGAAGALDEGDAADFTASMKVRVTSYGTVAV
jgi:hypothetical protein